MTGRLTTGAEVLVGLSWEAPGMAPALRDRSGVVKTTHRSGT
jgi:hypothetical protein